MAGGKVTVGEAIQKLSFTPEVEPGAREQQVISMLFLFNGFDSRDLNKFNTDLQKQLANETDANKKANIQANFQSLTDFVQAEEAFAEENEAKTQKGAIPTPTQQRHIDQQKQEAGVLPKERLMLAVYRNASARIRETTNTLKQNIDRRIQEAKGKPSLVDRIKKLCETAKSKVTELSNNAQEKLGELLSPKISGPFNVKKTSIDPTDLSANPNVGLPRNVRKIESDPRANPSPKNDGPQKKLADLMDMLDSAKTITDDFEEKAEAVSDRLDKSIALQTGVTATQAAPQSQESEDSDVQNRSHASTLRDSLPRPSR